MNKINSYLKADFLPPPFFFSKLKTTCCQLQMSFFDPFKIRKHIFYLKLVLKDIKDKGN